MTKTQTMSEGDFNWDTLNEMLRDGQLVAAAKPIEAKSIELTYTGDRNCLRDGVKFIFENSNLIAQLENQHNDEQPIECTLQHIRVAETYCRDEFLDKLTDDHCLDAASYRPLSLLILQCFHNRPNESFKIHTDSKRLPLIRRVFGENFVEVKTTILSAKPRKFERRCTQIVFESGDIESAIDSLFANLTDRTITPWRINSIYVQETLRNQFYLAINDRLKALNSLQPSPVARSNLNGAELSQKFGGKYIESNNKLIALLIETLPKYIEASDDDEPPVVVNFFRTAKEVIQLMNDDDCGDVALDRKTVSIWTENISLLYELANSLNVRIVWVNSIGLYHQCIRQNGVLSIGLDERLVQISNS